MRALLARSFGSVGAWCATTSTGWLEFQGKDPARDGSAEDQPGNDCLETA